MSEEMSGERQLHMGVHVASVMLIVIAGFWGHACGRRAGDRVLVEEGLATKADIVAAIDSGFAVTRAVVDSGFKATRAHQDSVFRAMGRYELRLEIVERLLEARK